MKFLLLLIPSVFGALDLGDLLGKEDALTELYSRDSEPMPAPIAWGAKYMGGGAGEGDQWLSPEGLYPNKQEVKTDNVLPAYCNPPNPCPLGYTSEQGCLEEFENTADFSREFQGQQDCLCDQEHMFSCPQKEGNSPLPMDQLVKKANIEQHQTLVAKKFFVAAKKSGPRKKREAKDHTVHEGDYIPRQKKDGRNLHLG